MIYLIPVGFIRFPGQGGGPVLFLVEAAERGLVRTFLYPAGHKVNGMEAKLQGENHKEDGDKRIKKIFPFFGSRLGHGRCRRELRRPQVLEGLGVGDSSSVFSRADLLLRYKYVLTTPEST